MLNMQAYSTLWALLGFGMLPALRGHSIVDPPYFIGLAAVTIYIGAHRGLNSKQLQTISLEQARVIVPIAWQNEPIFDGCSPHSSMAAFRYLRLQMF